MARSIRGPATGQETGTGMAGIPASRQAGPGDFVDSTHVPLGDLPDRSRDGVVVGDATARNPMPIAGEVDGEEGPPPPKLFRVMRDASIKTTAGNRTHLPAGKVISTAHYDIRSLQEQGVRLKKHVEEPAEFLEDLLD